MISPVGVFIVIGGAIYFFWKLNKESGGGVTAGLFVWAVIFLPIIGWSTVGGVIALWGVCAHLLLIAGYCFYLAINHDKILKKEHERMVETWKQVNNLKRPDDNELLQIKVSMNLPLAEEYKKQTDEAAYQEWKNRKYKELYREKYGILG